MSFPTFLVGGAVRDELLGRECNDLDFVVEAPSFAAMLADVEARGGDVKMADEAMNIVKAKDVTGALGAKGQVLDFVLARRDSDTGDGRKPDFTVAGSLWDDLARRDFTVNAMARNVEDGVLVDPHGGQEDLAFGLLRAVGDPRTRFLQDALRVMRAFRFGVTLGFVVEDATAEAMADPDVIALLASDVVKMERKREELNKAFKADEFLAMERLVALPKDLREAFGFGRGLRVAPTLGTK